MPVTSHDHLIRAISRTDDVRIFAVLAPGVVTEAATRHGLSPAATLAVGRALTSGLLLATLTKGGERVSVQLVGDGPIGSITVDANDAGDVRGYALHPKAGPERVVGRGQVAETLGRRGVVNVVRDLGLKELYQGQVALVTGEIDEDVEAYLRTSEQVPSALGCEVVLNGEGKVLAAGGVLVQALPGGSADSVREVQHALRTGGLYDALAAGVGSAAELATELYRGGAIELIGEERGVRFQCRCSPSKIGDTLRLLSTVDLDEMIAEARPTEVTCNFCNTIYSIDVPALSKIRDEIAGGPRQAN
jgi:molecular chaperone Hsp33